MGKHICSSSTHRIESSRPALASQSSRVSMDYVRPCPPLKITNEDDESKPSLLACPGGTQACSEQSLELWRPPCQLGSWVMTSSPGHLTPRPFTQLLCCSLPSRSCQGNGVCSSPHTKWKDGCLNSRGTRGKADNDGWLSCGDRHTSSRPRPVTVASLTPEVTCQEVPPPTHTTLPPHTTPPHSPT